jgi:hypothetical protein
VKKTSVYLDDSDVERLSRLAAAEGRSQAEVIRSALAAYEMAHTAPRDFALDGSGKGTDRPSQTCQKRNCSPNSARDPHHRRRSPGRTWRFPLHSQIGDLLRREPGELVVPAPVSAEADYLIRRRGTAQAARAFLRDVAPGDSWLRDSPQTNTHWPRAWTSSTPTST